MSRKRNPYRGKSAKWYRRRNKRHFWSRITPEVVGAAVQEVAKRHLHEEEDRNAFRAMSLEGRAIQELHDQMFEEIVRDLSVPSDLL